ncbi:MAG TPA: type IV pili twitching motility protein PilT, partial [Verrucomicrobiota bacterium]|nr:type IV pili twitching motility protein PilT [Verrucomicrobiota bacterium]
PPYQQEQIRVMLAATLKGVVSQTLLPKADGAGRVAAFEVLVVNHAVSAIIREAKTHQIYSAIQTGSRDGMRTMEQSLARLVTEGIVTPEDALMKCCHPAELK